MGLNISKVTEVIDLMIASALETNDPSKFPTTMLWGPPGIGKSSAVRQAAEKHGIGFKDVRLSLLNPIDLRGLPIPNKELTEAKWLPPIFLPSKSDPEMGILFLDEFNAARESVLVASLQLILDKAVGEYSMPPMWFVVAAGNRTSDHVYVQKLSSAHANRMVHIDVEPDLKTWKTWAYNKGINPLIIGFLSMHATFLVQQPGTTDKKGNSSISTDFRGFCTPRSWEMASNIYGTFYSDRMLLLQMLEGTVGAEAASQFLGYAMVEGKLPDFNAILEGKTSANVEKITDPALCWGVSSGLVGTVMQMPITEPVSKRFIDYMCYALSPDFQTKTIYDLYHSGRWMDFIVKKPFAEWFAKNGSSLQKDIK